MTGTPYAGDPALNPSTIQLPVDSDPQLAMTYAPALQSLMDKIVYLQSKTTARWLVNFIALQGISDASVGDTAFVLSFGWYNYIDTPIGVTQSPWLLDATGMGVGQWIHEFWFSLLDQGAPAKLKSGLLTSGLSATMQGITNATDGDPYYVNGSGWYVYNSSVSAASSPWILTATGMGVGCWIHEALGLVMRASAPIGKLNDAVLPYMQIVRRTRPILTSPIVWAIEADWTDVIASDGLTNIQFTISAAGGAILAYDDFDIDAGPFMLSNGSADLQLQARIVITQNSIQSIFPVISRVPAGVDIPIAFPIKYKSNGAYDITIELQAKASATTGTPQLTSPEFDTIQQWGESGWYDWLSINQYRSF